MPQIPYVRPAYDPRGSRIADLILRQGDISAERTRRSGEITGQAISQVGQEIGRSLGDLARYSADAPKREAEQLHLQGMRDEAKARTRATENQSILQSAQGSAADPEIVKAQLQQLGRGDLIPIYEKAHTDLQASRLTLQSLKDKSAEAGANYFGSLAAAVKRAQYDPLAVQWALSEAERDGHDVTQITQMLQAQPERLPQIIDSLIDRSPEQRKLAGEEQDRALKRDVEARAVRVSDQAQADRVADNARQDAAAVEAVRHNKAMEARPVAGAAAAAAGALTPDGLELAATAYRLTKSLPARSATQNAQIISAAAKQEKALGRTPVQTIQRQAAFKADSSALTKMQTMSSAAEAFETKANQQADLVQSLSQKVGRTQFPLVNSIVLGGKAALGDTDTHLFSNALLTFTTEYAKIMEGSTGSVAGSSESGRKAAAELISTALNKGTVAKTLAQMQWEMRQTILGYDATIAHITERMGGGPAPLTTAPVAPAGWKYVPKPGGGWTAVEAR